MRLSITAVNNVMRLHYLISFVHGLGTLLQFCLIWRLQPQPSPRPVWVSRRWSMCQEPEMKPESRRWVRWTLDSWCHLQWALMTSPSCFGALRHTLQHLSDGDLARTTATRNRARCSQGFYYSPAMKPTEVKWGRQYISSRAWLHSASLAEKMPFFFLAQCPLFSHL